MITNKRKNNKKKIQIKREDSSAPYVVGDFCYYLDAYNKVGFAEIITVHTGSDEQVYTIMDQSSQKYITIHHMFCNDEEKFFKKKKRVDIQKENQK